MKHYLIEDKDELMGGVDIAPPLWPEANGHAYLFHYHQYNFPVDEIEYVPAEIVTLTCYHRVVFQGGSSRSIIDVDSLWHDIIEKLHFHEQEFLSLLEFAVLPVVICQNCGTSDILYKHEACMLCDAPLCKTCYSTQQYCKVHLN